MSFDRRIAKLGVVVTAIALAMAPGAVTTPVVASDERAQQTQSLETEFRESTKAAARAYAQARELQAAAEAARAATERAQRGVAAAEQAEVLARAQARTAAESARSAGVSVDEAERDMDVATAEIGELARDLYVQGPTSAVSLALNADDLTAMLRELEMNEWAGELQERRITAFERARRNQVEAARVLEQRLATAQEAADRATVAADSARRAARVATRASRTAVRLSGQAMAMSRRAKAAAVEDETRLRAFQAETRRLREALRSASTRPSGPSSSGLILPVNAPITSSYGMRQHPLTGEYKMHTGTDFGAPCGTPVSVAANGRVMSAGFDTGYGYRVVVRHGLINGKDLTTTYNHLSVLGASAGATVTQGQVIGSVGSTGYSSGCHLHYEVLVGGTFVDPMAW